MTQYLKDLKPDEVATDIVKAIRAGLTTLMEGAGCDIRWKPEQETQLFQAARSITVFAQTGKGLTPSEFDEAEEMLDATASKCGWSSTYYSSAPEQPWMSALTIITDAGAARRAFVKNKFLNYMYIQDLAALANVSRLRAKLEFEEAGEVENNINTSEEAARAFLLRYGVVGLPKEIA